jgi:small-conductance mechanosensitive channel
MILNAYVGNIDVMGRVKHELNTAVARAFLDAGIECAYPHRDVTVRAVIPLQAAHRAEQMRAG